MILKIKYDNIIKLMNKVNYEKLWPGFSKYNIALYDDKNVCYKGNILPKTNEFIANTAISFQNEMIGIWGIRDDTDDEILTSKLIHETFHAFQNEKKESRYPNEFEAVINYQYDVVNLSMKMMENQIILKLIDSFSEEQFTELMRIRNKRMQLFPYETKYELAIEQIEGTASYIELEALKQLNFDKYLNKLNKMKENILNVKSLIPIRIISYDVGALLIKILFDNKLLINYHFDNNYYLVDHINDNVDISNLDLENLDLENLDLVNLDFENLEIRELIDNYYFETKEMIEKSVNQKNLVIQGLFKLIGFNVYNARFFNNYIISTYFLIYEDIGNEVVLKGDYVFKINDLFQILEIYHLMK